MVISRRSKSTRELNPLKRMTPLTPPAIIAILSRVRRRLRKVLRKAILNRMPGSLGHFFPVGKHEGAARSAQDEWIVAGKDKSGPQLLIKGLHQLEGIQGGLA